MQLVAMFASVVATGMLAAQTGDSTSASAKSAQKASAPARGSKAKPPILVTPEREAAVMTFVQRNHAELADLLTSLKTSQPQEYERAIKEIFRTIERLAVVQERDPRQYELEVVAWTAQSGVQLLAAKLKMSSSDELIKQLREALASQNDARLALLQHERQRFADRLSKLDSDIASLEDDGEKIIDKQVQVLSRAAAEGRSAKVGAKNAAKQVKKNVPPK